MKAKSLIERLQQFDPETEVRIMDLSIEELNFEDGETNCPAWDFTIDDMKMHNPPFIGLTYESDKSI